MRHAGPPHAPVAVVHERQAHVVIHVKLHEHLPAALRSARVSSQ